MAKRSQSRFLPDYLLFLLATASASTSAEFHNFVGAAGLRVPEWRVLASLWDEDGQMVTHLARLSLMEPSRLTRVIERMVDRGFATRQGDEVDRRRVRVWLTRAGRSMAAEMVAEARAHETKLLNLLGPEDGRMLKSLLERMNTLSKRDVGASGTGEIFPAPHPSVRDSVRSMERMDET